jgi:hypothetical protein
MAKLEAGRATLHAAAFDLRRVVDDLVDMFRLRAAAKGLQLHLLWAEPACHIIYGDELKLRQVLINLLGNAVKFTTSGAITVGVLQIEGVGGSHLVCTVQDTGPGIAPADQATIFEPFVQAAHTSAPGEGTGLGLPISRQFARLMGGDVTVVSAGAPGQGSLFRLEIPMHCVADAGAPEQPVQPPAYGPSSSTAVQSPAASAVNAAGGARALGAGWRARVWAAAVAADAPALQLLAAQLAAEQPAIATQLSGWTAAYDYDAIKRAMEETT